MISVVINGNSREFERAISLKRLLESLDLPDRRIAVELNKQVVRQDIWDAVEVRDKDKIEIIHFVGGG